MKKQGSNGATQAVEGVCGLACSNTSPPRAAQLQIEQATGDRPQGSNGGQVQVMADPDGSAHLHISSEGELPSTFGHGGAGQPSVHQDLGHQETTRSERAHSPDLLMTVTPTVESSDSATCDDAVGTVIGGRYKVEALLGTGGFSTVYRVSDTLEDQVRALKLFAPSAGCDSARREFNALRQARHPNIVQVIALDTTSRGECFLIIEYVEGELVADYTTGQKHLNDLIAIDLVLDVLDALIFLHPDLERSDALRQKGEGGELTIEEHDELRSIEGNALVHRDIKPRNIMISPSGAKLLDFNIASPFGDTVTTVSGTPPYQPPGLDCTRWGVSTDLFAVGVTMYELVCRGKHPYLDGRPVFGAEIYDPREFRNDLTPGIAEFLLRACAPERDLRFQSAVEMKEALVAARPAD